MLCEDEDDPHGFLICLLHPPKTVPCAVVFGAVQVSPHVATSNTFLPLVSPITLGSQSSPICGLTTPSPQTTFLQSNEHVPSPLKRDPASHCSPLSVSMMPFQQPSGGADR